MIHHIKLEEMIAFSNGVIDIDQMLRNIHHSVRSMLGIGSGDSVFIFSLAYEPYDPNEMGGLIAFIEQEMWLNGIRRWYLLLNDAFTYDKDEIRKVVSGKVVLVDYMALVTEHRATATGQVFSDQWHPCTGKALFLTGKAHYPHRIGLLSRFYDLDMMDKLVWSLHVNEAIADRCRSLLTRYDDDAYEKFLERCTRNPDDVTISIRGDSSHYDGFPHGKGIYEDTSFSLVSESQFTNRVFSMLSEKTYRAVLNNHPFVMAGSPGTLANLERFGFRSFSRYMRIPVYDSIRDHDRRLEAVIENTIGFFDSIQAHEDEIRADVKHNHSLFGEHCSRERARLSDLLETTEWMVGLFDR